MVFIHKVSNGIAIGDVEFVAVCIIIGVLWIVILQQLYLVAQLSVATCYKDVHLPIQIAVVLLCL